jgi:hypothetical protein
MKRTFVVLAICLLACSSWVALHAQDLPAGISGSTFLTTITDANTGAFSSRSLITVHSDHSFAAVDSGQGGPGVNFSSQLGAWRTSPNAGVIARTFDFSFPNAGIARVDYNFTTISGSQVVGTITVTVFPINADPTGGGGTVIGNFNFTGQRVTVP